MRSYVRPKVKKKASRGKSLVELSIDEQNDELGLAESTKGRRKKDRFTGRELGLHEKLPGKKFDEWIYQQAGLDPIKIPVRVVKHKGKRADSQTKTTYFQVILPDYAINEVRTDIERLRNKVFELLEAGIEIDWRHYYLIELQGREHPLRDHNARRWGLSRRKKRERVSYDDEEDEEGDTFNGAVELTMKIEEWELGTIQNDRKVSRRFSGPTSWRDPTIRKGWPKIEVNDEDVAWRGPAQTALLEVTPENTAALLEVIRGLSILRTQLDKLLHPDVIEGAFRIAAQNLARQLPAPEMPAQRTKRAKKARTTNKRT